MSLDGYLAEVAEQLTISDEERSRIDRSVETIQSKLNLFFESSIKGQYVFGSYERDTLLPRSIDEWSDVDLLIEFKKSGYKAQWYIEQLRKFCEKYYPKSALGRANPTFALELAHLRFELVPALSNWFNKLKIPAPRSDDGDWIPTTPESISTALDEADNRHYGQIRPLVRIIKYWNILNNRPFQSYKLEQSIIETEYRGHIYEWLKGRLDLFQYFHFFVSNIQDCSCFHNSEPQKQAIKKLEEALNKIDSHLSSQKKVGTMNAHKNLRKLLPPIER